MAPLIQESDASFSFSDDDDLFVNYHKRAASSSCFLSHDDDNTPSNSTSNPPSKKSRSRRCVSFAPTTTIRETMSLRDYTADELGASFYRLEDMRVFKEVARFEARLLDADDGEGTMLYTETSSPRGIEHRTRKGLQRKRRNRQNAYAAVFFEIDAGGNEDDDDEAIADAYYLYSEPCAAVAHALGKRDEIEAMRIHHEVA